MQGGFLALATPATGGSAPVLVSDFSVAVVPEPASVVLMLAGVAALAAARRRKA